MTKPLEALIADMKAAAEKALKAPEIYKSGESTIAEHVETISEYHALMYQPQNILALIAALEQSQQLLNDGMTEEALTLRKHIAEIEATLEREREKSRRVMSKNQQLEAKK